MREYVAKTLEEVLKLACEKENVREEDLCYELVEEKKGLFSKKAVINVYGIDDVIAFAKEYLTKIMTNFDLEVKIEEKYIDGIIHLVIDTNHNSIIIGKNGKTLQSLNDVVRNAISSKFKKHFRILLDINSYKNEKYEKLTRIAKRYAKEVLQTKGTIHLNPMPSDERRIIHNALTKYKNISTKSEGVGNKRHIVLSYKD